MSAPAFVASRRPLSTWLTRRPIPSTSCRRLASKLCASTVVAFLLAAVGCTSASASWAPLHLDPVNRHYYFFQGHPTLLITSGEHYGAVMNEAFNYREYLEELHSEDLNATRLFTGQYREFDDYDAFTSNTLNTLNPPPGEYLTPWARSSVCCYGTGATAQGIPGWSTAYGNKFDLSRWDPAYFKRLNAYVALADKLGIVVEIDPFSEFYSPQQWSMSPLNPLNNINGVGNNLANSFLSVNTLDNDGLIAFQDALVRKEVTDLDRFDNIYYEVDNEPGGDQSQANYIPWEQHITDTIMATEASLPNQHLIAWDDSDGNDMLTPSGAMNPDVSVVNFHSSGAGTVTQFYYLDRPLGDDELDGFGGNDATYRTLLWDWILAGGADYNNLDMSFTIDDPRGIQPPEGAWGGGAVLRGQLGFVARFMATLPFQYMYPSDQLLTFGPTDGSSAEVMADPDGIYLTYLTSNGATPTDEFTLKVRSGTYAVEWIDPTTGTRVESQLVRAEDGELRLTCPSFDIDQVVLAERQSAQALEALQRHR